MTIQDKESMSFVCFGGEDWWYKNRGHIDMQLMRRFARLGPAVYINSIVMQKPSLKKNTGGGASFTQKFCRKTKSILMGLKNSDAGFWVYSPFTLPVHHLAWARGLNDIILKRQVRHIMKKLKLGKPIMWVACPAACNTALRLREGLLAYQRTDRFEEYPNVDNDIIKAYDRKLKESADLTIFVNKLLFDEEKDQCKEAIYLDHGVDYELFSTAEQSTDKPEDMVGIPKPIVGFFGGIDDHTSDISLVEEVVNALPDMSFVFVGDVSADVSRLQGRKNVCFLGYKLYEQIPGYGKCFDVAIMPWQKSRWIQACNPIKLKEYLALGKPIVSTPFAELEKYRDVVYEAKTSREFAECIQRALKEDSQERISARKRRVEKASWDSKAQFVLGVLFENGEPIPS
jgi:glycosyltransferase involved in cell wall biosynthesis